MQMVFITTSNRDLLIQLNRTNNRLDQFSGVLDNVRDGIAPCFSGPVQHLILSMDAEITVAGDLLVIAEDASAANNQNKLLVYK